MLFGGTFMTIIEIIVTVAFALLIFMCFIGIIGPVERYRKWKHPKWYEYYNKAKSLCFDNAEFMKATMCAIEYQHDVLLNMLKDDRIDEQKVKSMYISLTEAFKVFKTEYDYRQAKVDELLHLAHDYAVKNNLKWGLLYDRE